MAQETQDIVEGTKIHSVRTLGSMYDNGDIIEFIDDDDTIYRVSLKRLIYPLLNDLTFDVIQKRKYKHLELRQPDKEPV